MERGAGGSCLIVPSGRAMRLTTRVVQDGGSSLQVVKATLAVPAGHSQLSTLPRNESGVLNINGIEVPSLRWPPTTRGRDRVGCGLPQHLVLALDRIPTQLVLSVGVIRVRYGRVQEDARVAQQVAGLERARDHDKHQVTADDVGLDRANTWSPILA